MTKLDQQPESKLDQLEKLLLEATAADWLLDDEQPLIPAPDYGPQHHVVVCGSLDNNSGPNAALICFLRNNAESMLKVLRAVEKCKEIREFFRSRAVSLSPDIDKIISPMIEALDEFLSHDSERSEG